MSFNFIIKVLVFENCQRCVSLLTHKETIILIHHAGIVHLGMFSLGKCNIAIISKCIMLLHVVSVTHGADTWKEYSCCNFDMRNGSTRRYPE